MEEHFDNLKESLKNSEEENKIYEINWKLKEICKELKKKYHILENWSKEEQSDKIDHYHFFEILYYECCLEMLKNKFSPPKIDYRHYLIVAELEYSYFIEKGKEFNKIFEKFQRSGTFEEKSIDLILNNMELAQKNIHLILKHIYEKKDHKDLFIYYELLGDVEVHIFNYFLEFGSKDINRNSLLKVFINYEKSIWHKTQLEKSDPRTYYEGLRGWASQSSFYNFYKNIGLKIVSITNVRKKREKLIQAYPLTEEEENTLKISLEREIDEF